MPKYKKGWVPKEYREYLTCKECNKDLPVSQFRQRGISSTGLKKFDSRCIECLEIYAKTNWASFRNYKNVDRKTVLMQEVKQKCVRCGYDTCKAALDFHHIDNTTKLFDVSDGVGMKSVTDEVLLEEIEKCVVLCSNCHREYHAGMWSIEEVL